MNTKTPAVTTKERCFAEPKLIDAQAIEKEVIVAVLTHVAK